MSKICNVESFNTDSKEVVPPDIVSLHDWLRHRDFQYFTINSTTGTTRMHFLYRSCTALGVLRRQVFRLSPINFRGLFSPVCFLGDPKSAVLLAKGYVLLWKHYRIPQFLDAFKLCVARVAAYKSPITRNFAVRANRHLYLMHYTLSPDEVSPLITAWAGELFLDSWQLFREERYLEMAAQVAAYFMKEHPHDDERDGIYYYYEPKQSFRIYNASAVISAFLVRAGTLLQNAEVVELGRRGIDFICSRQNTDGSWFYGEMERYIDGFHSAFILDALRMCTEYTNSQTIRQHLDAGVSYYCRNLFRQVGDDEIAPKHFVGKFWPRNSSLIQRVDLRDAALAVILFTRLSKSEGDYLRWAASVLNWTNKYMKSGSTYMTEITWAWKNRIPYIEFQAWMLLALAEYYLTVSEQ